MKLATLRDGSRDGQLAVVSRDLARAHYAAGIARTLQQVLDDWNFLSPQLQDLYVALEGGKARHAFAFDPAQCLAPLPRAGQLALAPAEGEPAVQHAGNALLGACDAARFVGDGVSFAPGLAVVTGDVAFGADAAQAAEGVRLALLVNGWRLHEQPWLQPAPAFGPVAVTPDELGPAWDGGRLHAALATAHGGQRGTAAAGADFGALIAQLAQARPVRAGSIVGACTPGALAAWGERVSVELDGLGRIEQVVERLA